MQERPEPPPEGKLIAAAADRMSLSIREAARRAGISYGRWRQIVTGYQNVSPGNIAAVRAPARTLAKMAAVTGITPEQMETEGQRPDAAGILREILSGMPDHGPASLPALPVSRSGALERNGDIFPRIDPAIQPDVDREYEDIEPLVISALGEHPETRLRGRWVFGDGNDAARWDSFTDLGWTLWQRAMAVAVARVIHRQRGDDDGYAEAR